MLKDKIEALLEEYLEAPEAWSDNVMIEVNPESVDARLAEVDDEAIETSPLDYWAVMDLLQMSVSNPGEWEIDREALDELAASYLNQ